MELELGFFTFTGHGFTFDEAVKQAEDRVNQWLKTHQLRGRNNEPQYHFSHGNTLIEGSVESRLYRHVISVFGPTLETEAM